MDAVLPALAAEKTLSACVCEALAEDDDRIVESRRDTDEEMQEMHRRISQLEEALEKNPS